MSEFAVRYLVRLRLSGALSLLSVGLLASDALGLLSVGDDKDEFSTHVTSLWEDHYTEFHPFYCISW